MSRRDRQKYDTTRAKSLTHAQRADLGKGNADRRKQALTKIRQDAPASKNVAIARNRGMKAEVAR